MTGVVDYAGCFAPGNDGGGYAGNDGVGGLVMTGRWVGNDGELGLNSVPLLV